jgi:two-component system chemotaxis sensor kinase CheA
MELNELYQTFFDEAGELLDDMERSLLALDPEAPDDETLNAIFRAAHSIKGGAGAFGFTVLQETTHRLENLLDRARHHELVLERTTIDVLLEARDRLKEQVDAYRNGSEPEAYAHQRICARLQQLAEAGSASTAAQAGDPAPAGVSESPASGAAEVPRTLVIRIRDVAVTEQAPLADELALLGDIVTRASHGETLTVTLRSTASPADIESVLCFIVDAEQISITAADTAPPAASAAPAPGEPESAGDRSRARAGTASTETAGHVESASLRVATDKVDHIINLVGELVITQAMLEQAAARANGEATARSSRAWPSYGATPVTCGKR